MVLGTVDKTSGYEIHTSPPKFTQLSTDTEVLFTGIKVIDLLEPYSKGGKIGAFWWCRCWEDRHYHWSLSIILPKSMRDYPFFAGVGERTREGNDLLREMIESGVIKYGDAFFKKHGRRQLGPFLVDHEILNKSQATLVFGQMNEPPGARCNGGLIGTYGSRVHSATGMRYPEAGIFFSFVDNIFRFTQAGSEVSALLGRMPSAVG